MKMKVVAYDPFLSAERALDIGVEKVELEELLRRADFITLHTPLTDKTRNIINANSLKLTKKSVRLINCARGGLVDEAALYEALSSGRIAGAALDVFVAEPATESPLFALPNVVCTPHLGASTSEAQENVALANRRANVRLPDTRCHLQCGELSLDQRRGSAEAQAVRGAWRTNLARLPASSPKPASSACRCPTKASSPR